MRTPEQASRASSWLRPALGLSGKARRTTAPGWHCTPSGGAGVVDESAEPPPPPHAARSSVNANALACEASPEAWNAFALDIKCIGPFRTASVIVEELQTKRIQSGALGGSERASGRAGGAAAT
jgi:hypothetical protein